MVPWGIRGASEGSKMGPWFRAGINVIPARKDHQLMGRMVQLLGPREAQVRENSDDRIVQLGCPWQAGFVAIYGVPTHYASWWTHRKNIYYSIA